MYAIPTNVLPEVQFKKMVSSKIKNNNKSYTNKYLNIQSKAKQRALFVLDKYIKTYCRYEILGALNVVVEL